MLLSRGFAVNISVLRSGLKGNVVRFPGGCGEMVKTNVHLVKDVNLVKESLDEKCSFGHNCRFGCDIEKSFQCGNCV